MKSSIDTQAPKRRILSARGLASRYAIALALIFGFVTASHIASVSVMDELGDASDLITRSINQRRNVQRVLSNAELASSLDTPLSRARLAEEIDRLETTHNALAEAARGAPDVALPYFQGGRGPALDPIMRKYIADARLIASGAFEEAEAADALSRLRRAAQVMLPRALQEANEAHQLSARGSTSELRMLQGAAFVLAIAVLALEALFIFIPAHGAVRRSLKSLKAQAQRLEHEAHHDALTELLNRRGLARAFDALAGAARANERGLALFQIDIDRFKEINDALGHTVGDAVLRHSAEKLRGLASEGDVVARVGGDEFVILRESDGNRNELTAFAAQIAEELGAPFELQGGACAFEVAIGVSYADDVAGPRIMDGERMMADSDIALHQAKDSKRVVFFSRRMRADLELRKELSDDLNRGLQCGEFFPVYQPQFNLRTGALHGIEALARWRHPTRGVLSPGVFLPIAERLNKTADIDHAIQEQALRDFAEWDSLRLGVPRISVNVRFERLYNSPVVQQIIDARYAPGRVHMEVLETAFTDTIDSAQQQMIDRLRRAGVALEIDDFGTGHASLLGLASLRPERVKIARELVSPIPESEDHINIVRSICQIATLLGIETTAEGVETPAQRDWLLQLGCDVMQGFLFARPMEAAELIARVRRGDWAGLRMAS